MDGRSEHGYVRGERLAPAPEETDEPSLEQLLTSTRDLYAETTAQFRDIGELAFMEFELALKSFQWGILALLLFGASSILACTFLMVATILVFLESAVSPAIVMVLCGSFSAIAALFLYLFLKSLRKKMAFSHLRSHLTQVRDQTHVGS